MDVKFGFGIIRIYGDGHGYTVDLDSDHRILSVFIKVSPEQQKEKPCSRNKFN